jgi:hypothetical protein
MSPTDDLPDTDDLPKGSFAEARAKNAHKFDTSRSGRKGRAKRTARSINSRSLNGTGRHDQFNFRCTPELKELCHRLADEAGVPVAEWMETALESYIAGKRGAVEEQPAGV